MLPVENLDGNFGFEGLNDLNGVVCGSVIHDDHFMDWGRLQQKPIQCFLKEQTAIVGRNDS